jgi:hypothetical protein
VRLQGERVYDRGEARRQIWRHGRRVGLLRAS